MQVASQKLGVLKNRTHRLGGVNHKSQHRGNGGKKIWSSRPILSVCFQRQAGSDGEKLMSSAL